MLKPWHSKWGDWLRKWNIFRITVQKKSLIITCIFILRLFLICQLTQAVFWWCIRNKFCWKTNIELFILRELAGNEFSKDGLFLFLDWVFCFFFFWVLVNYLCIILLLISVQCLLILIQFLLKIISEFAHGLCS